MRSRGFGGAAIVALLLVGCGGRPPVKEKEAAAPPTPTEVKVTPLTNAKVTAGRAAGYLPSLTVPYAPVEILGPPAGLATPTEACVAAGKGTAIINNSGVVVGYDCRNNPGAWMPSGGLAYYPLYSAARTVGPLSTATANVLPTFALPVPTNNRGAMPFAINDSGTIAGYAYPTDQNLVNQGRWPGVIWESGSYPSPYTLTNLDSLWTVGGITNGVKPKLVGGDWNADWITYDTASATAPTVLADPASGLGLGNLYGTNSWGDLVGNYQKSDGTWWAWARKDGAWVDINAVAQTPHPFARIEGLRAVNDSRRAVGWGIFPGGTASSWTRRALQYDLVTNTVTLIPISPNRTYQGQEFIAKGINAKGHVVGAFMGGGALGTIGVYPQGKGWVWTPEYGIRELDTFINPALGLSIGDGHAINDYDEVAALDARVISGAWKVQLLRTKVDFGGPEFIEPSAGLNCSMASAINNASAVTGWSDACANNPWPSAGQAIPFATTASGAPVRLGAPTDPGGIHATAINEAGNVVATRFVSATSTFAPVVYRAGHWDVAAEQPSGITGAASLAALDEDTASGGPRLFGSEYVTGVGQTWFSYFDGTKTALPRLASANTDGALLGANDAGEAVGFFGTSSGLAAAAYTGGATTALSASGWTSLNAAYAINAAHQVVGYGVKGGATRAFKMTLGGNTVEIPALESPYANLAHVARAINAAGQVVGTAGTVDLLGHVTGQRAFIFSEDTGITDLNALTAMPAGWVLADASGINDSGEVVGYAVDAAGVRRAYKMKVPAMPVTECAGKADGASCNDLNRCTQNDTCQAGVCVGSNPVVCNGTPNQCQLAQTCDVNTGLCVFPNKAAYTACNDNNPCSLTDACFNGVCTGTTFKQCVAKDQCHVAGVCDTGTGQCPDPVGNEGAACNDGNACTTASVCTAGTCTGTTQAPPCASGTTCDPATTANYLPEGVPQSALAALWHMDDHRDSSENAAHWAVASSALPSKVVPGKVGGALEFEGTHWLGVSSPYYYDVTDAPGFTFAAWVKPNVTCPGTYGFLRRDWQFGLKLTCTAGGTPGLQVGMNTGAGPFSSLSYSAAMGAVPVGQWSHIAMTWDKQTIRIYVNGAEAGTVSKSGNLPAPVGYFQLGWNENYYRGTIDEAVLYRQALTPAQLATITTVAPTACKVPTCPVPANTCQVATYDAATSACVTTNKANGASCSDGNACTVGDTCLTGTCVAGAGAPTCSTAVTCQESTCDPQWKETPAADVVSLWHLDGNLTEPAGHNLTGTASVAAVAGKFGQAMHFDGVATSCATRPSTSGESFTNPAGVTIAAWVKPDSNACPSGVQHMIVNRAAEVGLNLVCSGNYLLIRPQLNTVEYNSLGAIPTGVWSHVAITYDPPTGKLDAYHNGARIGTWSVPPGTQVGTSQYGRGLTLQVGCGAAAAVDEAIVIRRSSTAAEIANMAGSPSLCNEHPKTCLATDTCHTNGTCDPQTGQCPAPPAKQAGAACSDDNACTTGDTCNAAGQCVAGTPVSVSCPAAPGQCLEAGTCYADEVPEPPTSGRVGWWRFEGDTRDSGGQGLDLVRNGGTVGEGRIGKAFEFDGNTCMHMANALPPFAMTGATAISMMAWVKTGAGWTCPVSGYRAIMGKGYDYSLDASCSGVNTPGLTHVFRNQGGTIDNGPTPVVGTQPQSAWTHVAVVWDGATIRRYVNGAFASSKTFAGIPQNVDPSFSIGCQTSMYGAAFANGYKGSIDEAVLYNRALGDSDISAYYTAASAHSCSYENKANGAACNGDGDACTKEACQTGDCVADGVVTCVAQDLCHTAGACDPQTGCSNPPIACAASDGCHDPGICNPATGLCSDPPRPGGSCKVGYNGTWMYEPTDGMQCSYATGLNEFGQIVGYSDHCGAVQSAGAQLADGFTTANDVPVKLTPVAGEKTVVGAAVSTGGFVVTNAVSASGVHSAAVYRPESLPAGQPLSPFGAGKVNALRVTYPGVGAWPTIVGAAPSGNGTAWASYDVGAGIPAGPPTLYPASGYANGEVLGTDEHGNVLVGYYELADHSRTAMIFQLGDAAPRPLNDLLGASSLGWDLKTATAVDPVGTTVVGVGTNGASERPFKMDLATGKVTDLEDVWSDFDGSGRTLRPAAINGLGHVVGTASGLAGELDGELAFVYTELSGTQNLTYHFHLPENWVLASAAGINHEREVAGTMRNTVTLERRAYKAKAAELPSAARLACAGREEGESCDQGTTCGGHNVCHAGVCGGGDPSDSFCLRAEGVVPIAGGRYVVLFGYDNSAGTTVLPTVNEVRLNGVVVADPRPRPPEWLASGNHPAVFRPVIESGQEITWRANGQMISGSVSTLPELPKVTIGATGYGVQIDGELVTLQADVGAYGVPPTTEPAVQPPDPNWNTRFYGALTGKLEVGPTGNATYTVPITLPPGIAGMAPSLSLAYNSQSNGGVAGHGWDLVGLSMIYRCSSTMVDDGFIAAPTGSRFDSVCIDGRKMWESSPRKYETALRDFSEITRVGATNPSCGAGNQSGAACDLGIGPDPQSFKVVTKSGETRYYGARTNARVRLDHDPFWPDGDNTTMVWLLDRVVDEWGNYFDVHYNYDNQDFLTEGIRVTQIDYTGHLPSSSNTGGAEGQVAPFNHVYFDYEPRIDTRRVRIAEGFEEGLPRKWKLTKIRTSTDPERAYSLTYLPDDPTFMLPTRLSEIEYCVGSGPNKSCLKKLAFDWDGGGYEWKEAPQFSLPDRIETFGAYYGTQFMDIDADGRMDFVSSREGNRRWWRNTGSGWQQVANPKFPVDLAKNANDTLEPTGVRLVDMNNDGLLDVVANEGVMDYCKTTPPGSICLPTSSNAPCIPQPTPGGTLCTPRTVTPAVFMHRESGEWSPQVQYDIGLEGGPVNFLTTDTLVDMDRDHRPDFVRRGPGAQQLQVFRNAGSEGFMRSLSLSTTLVGVDVANVEIVDLDNDGIVDVVGTGPHKGWRGTFSGGYASLYIHEAPAVTDALAGEKANGDIDGDGRADLVVRHRTGLNTLQHTVLLRTMGGGQTPVGTAGYKAALDLFRPAVPNPSDATFFNLLDVNADGLVDLVLDHTWVAAAEEQRNAGVGGQVLVNTGSTWKDLAGFSAWQPLTFHGDPDAVQNQAGPKGMRVPVVPNFEEWERHRGAAFIDLDGDGVDDLVQATWGHGSFLDSRAWLNKFRPPVIKGFPNGLAAKTTAKYVVTTTAEAADPALDVYSRGPALAGFTGTTVPLEVPIRVVASLTSDDGSGTGTMNTVHYHYETLTRSRLDRGPQGFKKMRVHDDASDTTTVVTYSQAYPYTGMPTSVVKYSGTEPAGTKLSETTTTYCDTVTEVGGVPNCNASAGVYPAKTSVFVYPWKVIDKAYIDAATQTTTTEVRYDAHGNPKTTTVQSATSAGDTYVTTTTNTYGSIGGVEERLGKPTLIEKTTVRALPLAEDHTPVTHKTAFQYSELNQWTDDGGTAHGTVALSKTKLEPGAGWPLELQTAYDYDRFGNVITTTSCQRNFADCEAGAENAESDSEDPSFRTTRVSFNPQDYGPGIGGSGTFLLHTEKGRFPVRTTNALGHKEYTFYDPATGAILEHTGRDGLAECYGYDPFGTRTSTTERCRYGGTGLTTTSLAYETTSSDPATAKVVTVTHPPTGGSSFLFTNAFGRKVESRARAFSGGFASSEVTYDPLGRIASETKPHLRDSSQTYLTTPHYDSRGRLEAVNQDLGVIGPGSPAKSIRTTTFGGLTTTMQETVDGNAQSHSRAETKNALGKVSKVVDAAGTALTYSYDADGNMTDTYAPGSHVHMGYDGRGRKVAIDDPDIGAVSYEYNGFGDLIAQTDAAGRTTMTYDMLGRMRTKTDSVGTSRWVYDVPGAFGIGIGRLAAMVGPPDDGLQAPCEIPHVASDGGLRAGKSYKYTEWGETKEVVECIDGHDYVMQFEYDHFGRQLRVKYPDVNGEVMGVEYHYTSLGYLHFLTSTTDGLAIWVATAMNALGQVTEEYTRNGVETLSDRNPAIGWLLNSASYSNGNGREALLSSSYRYDEAGNLKGRRRDDAVTRAPSDEDFTYDALDRLHTARVHVPALAPDATRTYDYDVLGNLKLKDGQQYTYTGCNAGPHAVCNDGTTTFVYDDRGNLIGDSRGRSVAYNPAGKVTEILEGSSATRFVYGADGNRVVQEANGGGLSARTQYVGLGATGRSFYERTVRGNVVEHVQFVYAGTAHGGRPFALRTIKQEGTTFSAPTMSYYHADHLGSTMAVSDDQGAIVDSTSGSTQGQEATVLGYDAWGARRTPEGLPAPSTTFGTVAGGREFTGHERVGGFSLINMNGRIYDPSLGRFLSADPLVAVIGDLQSFNRYSYVNNNPLRYTDPTGYWLEKETDGEFDSYVNFTIAFVGTIACASSGPVSAAVCVGALIVGAIYNASSAIHNGAPWQQVAVSTAASLFISAFSAGIGSALGNGAAGVAWGMASSAFFAAYTEYANGGSGKNILKEAAVALAWEVAGVVVAGPSVSEATAMQKVMGDGDSELQGAFEGVVRKNRALVCGDPTERVCRAGNGGDYHSPSRRNQPKGPDPVRAGGFQVSSTAHLLVGLSASVSVFVAENGDVYLTGTYTLRWGFGVNLSLGMAPVYTSSIAPGLSTGLEGGIETPWLGASVSGAPNPNGPGGFDWGWSVAPPLPKLKVNLGYAAGQYMGINYSGNLRIW